MWLLHKQMLSWVKCLMACIIVTMYTCFTAGIELPLYPTNWNKCFATEPYFTMRFDTVQTCILECQLRPKCMGVNFYRLTNSCEMLDKVELSNLTLNKPKTPCVSIRKSEMPEMPSCPACSEDLVCDLTTNICKGKECPRLGPVENGKILGNMQVDRAKAKLKCDSDFPLEPADGKLVCQTGNWSHSNPRCVPKNCSSPLTVEDGSYEEGTTHAGSVRQFTCDVGYLLGINGDVQQEIAVEVTCQPGGHWSPTVKCYKDCLSPLIVEDGSYEEGTTHAGSVRQFTCDEGHLLGINGEVQQDTTANVTCQTSGHWSPTVECYKDCLSPLPVEDGSYEKGKTHEDSVLHFTCDEGYLLGINGEIQQVTAANVTCQTDGHWSPTVECYKDCLSPLIVEDGSYEEGTTHAGSLRPFTCDAGYLLGINGEVQQDTTANVTCQTSGHWSPTVKCYKDCLSPLTVEDGSYEEGTTHEGSVRQFTCDEGYLLGINGEVQQETAANVTCQTSGHWSPTVKCYKDCSSPLTVHNGSYEEGTTHEGSVRQFTCDEGYLLGINDEVQQNTAANVTCLTSGHWSPTVECYKECNDTQDLVMELDDEEIHASSHYDTYYAHECRLDSPNAWCPGSPGNQYIQFDFGTRKLVMGLTTKGGHVWHNNQMKELWVKQYNVMYYKDCSTSWLHPADSDLGVFDGNTDADSTVTNMFSIPIIAKCIRVHPTAWHQWIAMRIALLGCDVKNTTQQTQNVATSF